MRSAALLLLFLTLPLFAGEPEIAIVEKPEAVEFCKSVGAVKARSGWGGSAGCDMGRSSVRETLAKRTAALGGNVILLESLSCSGMGTVGKGEAYACTTESFEKQKAKRDAEAAAEKARHEELSASASREIRCEAGSDCEMKWSRVTQWLLANSDWKLRNVTDNLITTEGPLDTPKPAYEVLKIPSGDGKTYLIMMKAGCGEGYNCETRILELQTSFGAFVRGEKSSAK